jgi:hypothetical protein
MNVMKTSFLSQRKSSCTPILTLLLSCTFLLFFLYSCQDNIREHPEEVVMTWNFATGKEGWEGDFADYPVGEEAFYELVFKHDTLPAPLDRSQYALKVSGNNHSDDLFMFVKRKVTGLEPNMVYYVTFTVEFASDVPKGMMGVGGSPGESVYVTAGAVLNEPLKVAGPDNYYGMNIKKSDQSRNGEDMVVIGNFANGTDKSEYTLKTVSNEKPFHVTTSPNGELWIIVGTDSGFEATTTIYYNSIKVKFF